MKEADIIYGFEGLLEARKGPFSIYTQTDYFYAEYSAGIQNHFRPKRQLAIDVEANVGLDLELIFAEFGATYEIFKRASDPLLSSGTRYYSAPNHTALDLVVGGRYNSLDITTDILLTIGATLTPNIIPVSISRTRQIRGRIEVKEEWVDPFIGLRLRKDLGAGYQFFARGDVGGFDVSSDFVWQVIAGVSGPCKCNENLSWTLGYRALDTDYHTGSGHNEFVFDQLIQGPIVGANYRF